MLYEVGIPYLVCKCILGRWSIAYHYKFTVALTLTSSCSGPVKNHFFQNMVMHVAYLIKGNEKIDDIQEKTSHYSVPRSWVGSKDQNSSFSGNGRGCISNQRIWHATQNASNDFVLTRTLDPRGEIKRYNHFSSESSHVAFQIKGNETYDDMQENILPLLTNPCP